MAAGGRGPQSNQSQAESAHETAHVPAQAPRGRSPVASHMAAAAERQTMHSEVIYLFSGYGREGRGEKGETENRTQAGS